MTTEGPYLFPVFQPKRPGKAFNAETASAALIKWLRENNLATERQGMHSFHHTLADRLRNAGVPKDVREQASAAGHRSQLNACLDYVREGDVLVVTALDRLARSIHHLSGIVRTLETKGVSLRILNLGVDTSTPTGRLMLTLLGGVAQFEREVMLERQREGIAKAKEAGKYKGRKPRRVHILVKPTRPDISTNLVVTTDRRTYMIELRARESLYMPTVAWAYPAPPVGQRQTVPAAPIIPAEAARNYRYALQVQGDSPPWRPVSVFDDGRRCR
ncbi:recombinase family protein [Paenirhodobacter sp.]|uniref:recombinase family protein n=1 Tax=Paenirhodobacter sp. TaxID=1965326 RepID=UPI003B3ED82F